MAFEALLSSGDPKPARWRRAMLSLSLIVHGVALAVGVAHSLWQVEEMPMPAVEVMLTAQVPPPPPPPPPPAGKASRKPKTKPVEVKQELVQPTLVPKQEPEPEAQPEEDAREGGEPDGVVGGVKGGVRGGVLGGVVGGVKRDRPTPAPQPPKRSAPRMVSGSVGRQQLLINPNVDPYRVKVPRALARTGSSFSAMLRVCVSATGSVTSVQVLKGAGAAIDAQIPTVIGRWRYRPLTIGGQPTPFCYPLNYRIQ